MYFLQVFSPFIFLFGIFGNLVCYHVFRSKQFRYLPTFKFLSYLSIIDFMYILISIPHVVSIIYGNFDFKAWSNFLCSVHSFMTIFLSHLSSNILACVSIYRCIQLSSMETALNQKTLLKINHGTRKKTKKIMKEVFIVYKSNRLTFWQNLTAKFGKIELTITVLAVILFFFDSHYLLLMRLSGNSSLTQECYPSKDQNKMYYEFYTNYWPFIDMFLYSYMPFSVVILATAVIISIIKKSNNTLKKEYKMTLNNITVYQKKRVHAKRFIETKKIAEKIYEEARRRVKRNSSIYKLLILLNFKFMFLVTPLVICNTLKLFGNENQISLEILFILAYLNHCSNFFCYLFTSHVFRCAFGEIIKNLLPSLEFLEQNDK